MDGYGDWELAVVYEDGDGDWMLVGDVPWEYAPSLKLHCHYILDDCTGVKMIGSLTNAQCTCLVWFAGCSCPRARG